MPAHSTAKPNTVERALRHASVFGLSLAMLAASPAAHARVHPAESFPAVVEPTPRATIEKGFIWPDLPLTWGDLGPYASVAKELLKIGVSRGTILKTLLDAGFKALELYQNAKDQEALRAEIASTRHMLQVLSESLAGMSDRMDDLNRSVIANQQTLEEIRNGLTQLGANHSKEIERLRLLAAKLRSRPNTTSPRFSP